MARKLGQTQIELLKVLWNGGNPMNWYRGCGWVWQGTKTTAKMFDVLAARGLVTKTLEFGKHDHEGKPTYRYSINKEAVDAALAAQGERFHGG